MELLQPWSQQDIFLNYLNLGEHISHNTQNSVETCVIPSKNKEIDKKIKSLKIS